MKFVSSLCRHGHIFTFRWLLALFLFLFCLVVFSNMVRYLDGMHVCDEAVP